jgi:hypothetical protein
MGIIWHERTTQHYGNAHGERKDKTTGTHNSGFSYLDTVLVQRQDLVVQGC